MSAIGLFFLKNWKLVVAGVAVAAAALFFHLSQINAANAKAQAALAKDQAARADAAERSARSWQDAYDKAQALAEATAAAHAAEVRDISNIKTAAIPAKEGAAHAPGAVDGFTYSDAAYGFLRAHPSGAAGAAPAPAAGVGGR